MIEIRIHGTGGQGAVIAGKIIAEAAEAIPEPEEILQDVAAALGLDTGRMTLEQINLLRFPNGH